MCSILPVIIILLNFRLHCTWHRLSYLVPVSSCFFHNAVNTRSNVSLFKLVSLRSPFDAIPLFLLFSPSSLLFDDFPALLQLYYQVVVIWILCDSHCNYLLRRYIKLRNEASKDLGRIARDLYKLYSTRSKYESGLRNIHKDIMPENGKTGWVKLNARFLYCSMFSVCWH